MYFVLVSLITMVPEWNHFIFMQIDYPRWPPGAVTKKSMNTKMTISLEPLVEIDPTLFQNVSCMKPFRLVCNLTFQDGRHLLLLKIVQNMKMTISEFVSK